MVKDQVDPPSRPSVPTKLVRPKDWPPPPSEEIFHIEGRTVEKEESVSWVDYIFGKPKAERFSVSSGGVPEKPSTSPLPPVTPRTPMPNCLPPKVEKNWSYEVLSEPAHHITSKLNFYKERKRLRNIVSMTATDNTITILLEVYDW